MPFLQPQPCNKPNVVNSRSISLFPGRPSLVSSLRPQSQPTSPKLYLKGHLNPCPNLHTHPNPYLSILPHFRLYPTGTSTLGPPDRDGGVGKGEDEVEVKLMMKGESES